jgi:hypothetical protein
MYICAFITSTILHELGHAMAGLIFNSSPVLHHNYVHHLTSGSLSANQQIIIALAGPLTSLLLGFAAGWIFLRINKFNLQTLFLLWFCIFGLNNFLGYVMTAPLFSEGDISKIYQLTDASLTMQLIAAVFSAGFLLLIAYHLTTLFLSFSYKRGWVESASARKEFSFKILMLPWILGSVVLTILYLPIVAFISIIYPVMSGFIFIFPWQNATRIENVSLSKDNKIGNISFSSVIVMVILILVFKFILAPGIEL